VAEQPHNEASAAGAYNCNCNALNRLHGPEFAEVFAKNATGTVMAASIENYIQIQDIDHPTEFWQSGYREWVKWTGMGCLLGARDTNC